MKNKKYKYTGITKELIAKMNERRKREELIEACLSCYWPFIVCSTLLICMYFYFGQ